MTCPRVLAVLAGFSAIAHPALSQDIIALDEIIVSGGLTPVDASRYGRAATVITGDELEARGIRYAADALRNVPGVSVSRTGSYGGLTQVRLRGHEGNHTLVLIDGVAVAAPNQGEYDFGGLLAADIERIEVIRGPQSALYGSNAIGGVVSITTKRADVPGASGRIGTELGSDGTRLLDMAVRHQGERGDLSFSTARRQTDGFDISQTPGGRKDGDLNRTYSFNGSYRVTDTVTVGGTLRHVNRRFDDDTFNFGAPTREELVTDSEAGGALQETFGSVYAEAVLWENRLSNRLTYSFADIDRQGWDGMDLRSQDNTGTRNKLAYQASVALDTATLESAAHILTFGAEWERLTYRENDPAIVFDPGQLVKRTREQTAFVLEYQGDLGNGLALQASVRHDNNRDFKDFTTYAVGASYALPNGATRLHGSFGTGVQNPTLIEQFGFFSNFIGNPDLTPEQSKGWDIGIEQQVWGGRGIFDITYFDEELTNEIGSRFDPALGASVPVNNPGKSRRKGIEVAGSLAISDRLNLTSSYTWLDASEPVPVATGGTRQAVEVRRPEGEFSLGVDYTMANDRTRFRLDVSHVTGLFDLDFKTASFISGNPDDDYDRVRLRDYTLVNLGMTHELTDRMQLTGQIVNLLDEDYEELEGFGTQGRTVYVGLNARF